MKLLDLFNMGIEVQMSKDHNILQDAILFSFCKGDESFERIIRCAELVEFNGGSSLLEDIICREAIDHFEGASDKRIKKDTFKRECFNKRQTLKINDWVICSESGVIGRIIKLYTPTACEDQIMVETRDGRQYHAPADMWKPYQLGLMNNKMSMNEFANQEIPQPLLNAHGEYVIKFARNHGISVDEAHNHPTVKAHLECFMHQENRK